MNNEITYQLIEAADPMLSAIRDRLFEGADCERNVSARATSLDHATENLRVLLREIEHVRKEMRA